MSGRDFDHPRGRPILPHSGHDGWSSGGRLISNDRSRKEAERMVRLLWAFPLERLLAPWQGAARCLGERQEIARRAGAPVRSERHTEWVVVSAALMISVAGLTAPLCGCGVRASRADGRVPATQPHSPVQKTSRLRDQLLTAQSQNPGLCGTRRWTMSPPAWTRQDEAIERLEHSVQAYQDERGRLESAYRQLASSLGETGARPEARLSQALPASAPKDKPRAPAPERGEKARDDPDHAASKE